MGGGLSTDREDLEIDSSDIANFDSFITFIRYKQVSTINQASAPFYFITDDDLLKIKEWLENEKLQTIKDIIVQAIKGNMTVNTTNLTSIWEAVEAKIKDWSSMYQTEESQVLEAIRVENNVEKKRELENKLESIKQVESFIITELEVFKTMFDQLTTYDTYRMDFKNRFLVGGSGISVLKNNFLQKLSQTKQKLESIIIQAKKLKLESQKNAPEKQIDDILMKFLEKFNTVQKEAEVEISASLKSNTITTQFGYREVKEADGVQAVPPEDVFIYLYFGIDEINKTTKKLTGRIKKMRTTISPSGQSIIIFDEVVFDSNEPITVTINGYDVRCVGVGQQRGLKEDGEVKQFSPLLSEDFKKAPNKFIKNYAAPPKQPKPSQAGGNATKSKDKVIKNIVPIFRI